MLTHLNIEPVLPTRVVILGAGGFVSSAAQRRLEAQNVPVLALTQAMLDLTHKDAGALLANLLRTDDALLFVAAKAPVKSEAMLIENLRMGEAVCEALKNAPVNHVVYISSDAVYADSDTPLTERSCAQPGSLHGVMHLAREVMLANAWQGALCFLRPTLIYGEDDPHNGYGPNRFLRLAAKGEEIVLFGEGEERRDHLWVEDVAEIVSRVLLHRSTGILNIATGEVVSFRDIAEQVARLSARPPKIKGTPRVGPMPHNGYRAFNIASLYSAFPDFQCLPLSEGLKLCYNGLNAMTKKDN
ncbi:NAD-dependent epimerase/dehydratase family protein [Candidatus Bipolaricaulota bacterium]|nr:NAD-dependent epimerase/dehydratase family protein [Candidatus Bipolaricaulota bacterium]